MSTATDMRDKYIAAEASILGGQTVTWGDRTLSLANLAEVRAGRAEWEAKAAAEARGAAGGGRFRYADFTGCGR
jgi:hypothetical protein